VEWTREKMFTWNFLSRLFKEKISKFLVSLRFVHNNEIETLQEALQECDFIENLGLEFNE